MIWLLTSAVVDVILTPQCGRIVTLGSALTPVMLLHHITASAGLGGYHIQPADGVDDPQEMEIN